MLFTFSNNGLKIWPTFSGQRAICDSCHTPLVAKCGDIVINHWAHPRKSIAFAKRKVYLDLGKGWLFHLIKMYPDPPCAGIGELIHRIDLTYFLAIA
jgi:hypothetical protein